MAGQTVQLINHSLGNGEHGTNLVSALIGEPSS